LSSLEQGVPLRSRRPPLRLTAAEAIALIKPAPKVSFGTLITNAPKGDGHPVLVLPALMRGDPYTAQFRQFLVAIRYSASGWNLGINMGPSKRLLDGSANRLIQLSDLYGRVSIIGFSMGGLFARWLSLQTPNRVRQIITVCSPIHRAASNFWLPVEPFMRFWQAVDLRQLAKEVAQPLPVPVTVLFSRDDGLVNYEACRDPSSGPHVLIATNQQMMRIVAERLASKR
jgi:pimeloyl-ACP methyl ester carboxylesterase